MSKNQSRPKQSLIAYQHISGDLVSRPVTRDDYRWLYQLLSDRPVIINISHTNMPTFKEHCQYWDRVKKHWQCGIICIDGNADIPIGYWYLTDHDEIGLHIRKIYQQLGHGVAVLRWIIRTRPGKLLGNVAPKNAVAHRILKALGFRVVQVTYAKQRDSIA